MKAIVSALGLAAMVLVAVPASADTISNVKDDSFAGIFNKVKTSVKVSNNNAFVGYSAAVSSSSTGNNKIAAKGDVENAAILTGDAGSASMTETKANTSVTSVVVDTDCGCASDSVTGVDDESAGVIKNEDKAKLKTYNNNYAVDYSTAEAGSTTGDNEIKSWHDDVEGAGIGTGTAISASQTSGWFNSVFTSIVRK